ncbi:MAG: hypothetical protein ACREX8_14425 [Gammaproteobacteria bacterium]
MTAAEFTATLALDDTEPLRGAPQPARGIRPWPRRWRLRAARSWRRLIPALLEDLRH